MTVGTPRAGSTGWHRRLETRPVRRRVTIAVVLLALSVAVAAACGGAKKHGATPELASPTTAVEASPTVTLKPCTRDDFNLTLTTWASSEAVMFDVVAHVRGCLLDDVLVVGVDARRDGQLLTVESNRLPVRLAVEWDGRYPVGRGTWTSWCEPEAWRFTAFASLGGKKVNAQVPTPPACRPEDMQAIKLDAPPPPSTAPGVGCNPADLNLSLTTERFASGLQLNVVPGYRGAACLLREIMSLTILDPSGNPVAVKTNGLTAWLDEVLPSQRALARFLWSNWCGSAGPFSLRVQFAGAAATFSLDLPPACDAPGAPSQLVLVAPEPGAFPTPAPTSTPLPGGLRRVETMPASPTVWIYAGARPASTDCIEIVADMVPSQAATRLPAERFTCSGNLSRLRFVQDAGGTFYLHGVELLLLARITLPQNYAYSGCDDIREHLLKATDPLEDATYVLVCSVQPFLAVRRAPARSSSGAAL